MIVLVAAVVSDLCYDPTDCGHRTTQSLVQTEGLVVKPDGVLGFKPGSALPRLVASPSVSPSTTKGLISPLLEVGSAVPATLPV